MDRGELLSIIEKAAHYGRMHAGWDWIDVKCSLSRFLPPPPAEQASGEHFKALANLRSELIGDLSDKELAAINEAIAALSQWPVVDEAMVERGTAAAIKASNRYTGTGVEDAWKVIVRNVLTAALAPQQSEKGEG